MAESFPIKCRNCAEIIDVAANIDVVAPYECPLCGADIVIAEAEDFDLPCPAEVVIEEQTSERLRLSVPRFLPGTDLHMLLPIVLLLTVIAILVTVAELLVFHYAQRIGQSISLVGIFLVIFAISWKTRKSFMFLDISSSRMTIRHYFIAVGFDIAYQIVPHRNVTMEPATTGIAIFHGSNLQVRLKTRWWSIRFAESPNPDIARYVTHIIRRQLKTMGHKLQDG
ncbi:hypothetical protein [Symmachiella dynata]|uniref:hypothetical protein n=1 Tax=Symmachiella dynata TaxID=2527995 RepID=UPI0030ED039E